MRNFNIKILYDWLVRHGMNEDIANILNIVVLIMVILIVAVLSDILSRKLIVSFVTKIINRSKSKLDDLFLEKKVFHRLSHLAPAIVIYLLSSYLVPEQENVVNFLQEAAIIYMIILGLLFLNSLLGTLHQIYQTLDISRNRPINGLVQLVRIFIYFAAIILIVSIIFDKNPYSILAGLGALAAVLVLVFRDTILGFTASLQLSANDMVKPGDWIEMPHYNADGVVTEINLHTVKVRNWDQTFTTIPTYALVSNSFYNWKGMEQSGGRRIKRSINIDMKSIKFLDPQLREKLKRIQLIRDYVEEREKEIIAFNKKQNAEESSPVNGRRMTNIGIFRKYIENYLKQHPKIHNDMTFLVRHLQPTSEGLPLEIYVFSKEQAWANYEKVQADIFDHILAAISEFELRLFQSPGGEDFRRLTGIQED